MPALGGRSARVTLGYNFRAPKEKAMGYSLQEFRRDAAAWVKTGSSGGDVRRAGARFQISLAGPRLAL
jgi:hypothetical protein